MIGEVWRGISFLFAVVFAKKASVLLLQRVLRKMIRLTCYIAFRQITEWLACELEDNSPLCRQVLLSVGSLY
jgi:hypothetical protein